MSLLSVHQLQIPYSKKGNLRPLSFEVSSPALVFVTGSNGIGKSSFLKQLGGILDNNNSISIAGIPLSEYRLKDRAKLIGTLNQQHQLSFPLPVKDLVVMGKYAQKAPLEYYSPEDYREVHTVLDEMGIGYLYEKNFLTLSGGEQQLCLLAQLSLQDPAIILLDEPTQSLDLHNKARVFDWIEKQVQKKNKLVICVTHDLHWITDKKGFLLCLNRSQSGLEILSEELVLEVIEELKKGEV